MNDLSTMKGCIEEAIAIVRDAMCDLDDDIKSEEHYAVIRGLSASIETLEYYEGFRELLDRKDETIGKEIDGEWFRLKKASIDRIFLDGELEGIEYETDD